MGEQSEEFLDRMLGYGQVPVKSVRKNKNHRYSCACGHKTTKNQLKKVKGACHQCGNILNEKFIQV